MESRSSTELSMETNPIFEKAVSFVNFTNQHVFLTGRAGTGKTTFLKYIKENSNKKMAVLAPTGVAAINAGGSTIHSFFYLPFGTYIPTTKTVWGGGEVNVYNKHQLFAKAKLSQAKRDIIKALDTLIIDEISMVRADMLDAIDALLRMVRRRPNEAFGGLQMVFIGDMFQLPPVVKDADWEQLKEVYNSPYFFDAQVMKEAEPVYIELKKIFRQNDPKFIKILNNIRNNEAEEDDLLILNEQFDPYFIPDSSTGFITLTTHNYKADEINQTALEQLSSIANIFKAKITGEFPQNNFPVDEQLVLKEGAQIMFIKNDKGEERRFYNGKLGIISALDPIKKHITVKFLDEENELVLEPEEWKNLRYDFDRDADEVKEVEVGTFSQYPIRLAWAITIHKSQGLTFERAIVDAGKAFAPGQVYVALSRLRTLEGLVLKSKIVPESIHTDPLIVEFANRDSDETALENMLALSQKVFAEQSVSHAFNFVELYDYWTGFTKDLVQRAIPEKQVASEFALAQLDILQQLEKTSLKFEYQLQGIVNSQDKERYKLLSDRVQAGAAWFLERIRSIIQAIEAHQSFFKGKTKAKSYNKDLQYLWQICEKKRIQIEQAAAVSMGLASNIGIDTVIEEVRKMFHSVPIAEEEFTKDKKQEKEDKMPSREISLKMFQEGISPEKIAELRAMVIGTIYGHLAFYIKEKTLDINLFLKPHEVDYLMETMNKNPTASFSELKGIVGEKYDFNSLRIVKELWKAGN